MQSKSTTPDRRRAYRVKPPNAIAQCYTKKADGIYAVHDLSRGGVALTGRPPLRCSSKVSVRLSVPGYQPLTLDGTILRATKGPHRSSRVVVRFDRLEPDAEDSIGNIIVGELARGSVPRFMIASSSPRERQVLLHRLRALGAETLLAATPMEVIHRLETSSHRVDAIIIGGQVGDCDGVEFASFVAGAYPTLRRVLTGRQTGRRASVAKHVAHVSLDGRWGADDLRVALLENDSAHRG